MQKNFVFFTDDTRYNKPIDEIISDLPRNSMVIVRNYKMSDNFRLNFCDRVMKIAKEKSIKTVISADISIANKLNCDGLHIPEKFFNQNILKFRRKKDMIYTTSVHSWWSLKRAEEVGIFDIIFISPIFKTKSHPLETGIGIYQLREFVHSIRGDEEFLKSDFLYSDKPKIYALGGVNNSTINLLKNTGIDGVGGIEMFIK